MVDTVRVMARFCSFSGGISEDPADGILPNVMARQIRSLEDPISGIDIAKANDPSFNRTSHYPVEG
jgi:hypothetical protein